MKKILLLMAIILPFVFTSCGDDKDEPQNLEQELIGEWVENTNSNYEVYHYIFKSDHTGSWWVTNNNVLIDGFVVTTFTLSVKGNSLTLVNDANGGSASTTFSIKNGILHFDNFDSGAGINFKRVN